MQIWAVSLLLLSFVVVSEDLVLLLISGCSGVLLPVVISGYLALLTMVWVVWVLGGICDYGWILINLEISEILLVWGGLYCLLFNLNFG